MGLFDFIFGGSSNNAGVLRKDTLDNIRADWDGIKILLQQKGPSQLRQALITADKTLDNALRDLTIGEGMGERLKNAKEMFDRNNYQKVWEAHKLRNSLVHESNFNPPYFVVIEAVNNLKEGLRDLGINV